MTYKDVQHIKIKSGLKNITFSMFLFFLRTYVYVFNQDTIHYLLTMLTMIISLFSLVNTYLVMIIKVTFN